VTARAVRNAARPMVIGVTGGYCAGKSVVAGRLRDLGFAEIDVDRLGHGALEREKPRVVARFGAGIVGPGGAIDRRALGRLVFADRSALRDLEAIVHPSMVAEVERLLRERAGRTAINAAILFRMGLYRLCDLVVCVRAPRVVRIARAMRRDRVGPVAAARRIFAQGPVCPKSVGPDVDILNVSNLGSRERLFARLERSLRAKGAV
jgi:dephospho-CoA kinase